jgi:hypothetical protein
MNNNKNKATMKETSKNCVSDYPLSNTEVRGVAWHSSQSERAVCCCGCAFLKVEVKSSRWFGKGATSSIVTADVDIPDKVLEKRIHLAECERRKSKAFLLQGFLGIKSRSKSKSSETKWRRRTARMLGLAAAAAGTCDRVVKVSFGRVECASLLELSGTMKWSVLFLCLWTGRC